MKLTLVLLAIGLAASTGSLTASESPAPKKAAKPAKAAVAAKQTIIGDVNGIVCGFCAEGITKRFTARGKADQILISLEHKQVVVTEKAGQTITDEEFRNTIKEAGFDAQAIKRTPMPFEAVKKQFAAAKGSAHETAGSKLTASVAR